MQKAFTLIELLVVIAIIGILSGISLIWLSGVKKDADIGEATQLVGELHKVIVMNYLESGGTSPSPDDTALGLGCSYWGPGIVVGFVDNPGGVYANWAGPFFTEIPKDPWGNCYVIDGPISEECPGNIYGSTICSAGPDGVFEGWDNSLDSRGDDICKKFGCDL